MLENKNKEGDDLHVARGRYCNVYKVLTSKVELLCRKNAKARNKISCQNCNGSNKGKRKTTEKNRETRLN